MQLDSFFNYGYQAATPHAFHYFAHTTLGEGCLVINWGEEEQRVVLRNLLRSYLAPDRLWLHYLRANANVREPSSIIGGRQYGRFTLILDAVGQLHLNISAFFQALPRPLVGLDARGTTLAVLPINFTLKRLSFKVCTLPDSELPFKELYIRFG